MNTGTYIIANIIASILIIYLFHWLWYFILDKFSTRKKKELVNSQIKNYNNLVEELQKSKPKNEFTNEIKQTLQDDLNEFIDLPDSL